MSEPKIEVSPTAPSTEKPKSFDYAILHVMAKEVDRTLKAYPRRGSDKCSAPIRQFKDWSTQAAESKGSLLPDAQKVTEATQILRNYLKDVYTDHDGLRTFFTGETVKGIEACRRVTVAESMLKYMSTALDGSESARSLLETKSYQEAYELALRSRGTNYVAEGFNFLSETIRTSSGVPAAVSGSIGWLRAKITARTTDPEDDDETAKLVQVISQ